MNTIRNTTGAGIAQYMGQDATDEQGDLMRDLLIAAGHGDDTPASIDMGEWDDMLRAVAKADTSTGARQ